MSARWPWPRLASVGTVLVGTLVLAGWALDVQLLKSLDPGWVTMKANTAVAFVLVGLSLWLVTDRAREEHRNVGRRVGQACALVAGLIGLLTLFEYGLGWNLGIDQLLFHDPATAVATSDPGRMAPATAFNFLLVGSALALLDVELRPTWRPAAFLVVIAALVCSVDFVGYLYGESNLTSASPDTRVALTRMALHTSLTFLVLTAGIILARPERGLLATLSGNGVGSAAARRLLPFVIAFPVALGWLRLRGQHAGLYDSQFGLSVMTSATIVILVAMVWWTARSLNRSDAERSHAEEEIAHFFTLSIDMLAIADFDGHFVRISPAWSETLGWTTRELLEQPYIDLVHPDDRQATIAAAAKLADGAATTVTIECRFRCKDGSYRQFQWNAVSLAGQRQIYAAGRDVTAQKRAEEELRDSEERHRSVVDNIADGIIVIGERGLIESFNGAAERIFGYPASEVIGQNVNMLMPEPYQGEHDQYLHNYTSGGPKKMIGIGREVEGRRKNGESFPLDLAVTEITLGGRHAFVGITRDISRRKRAEEAAFRSDELLKAATMESTADGILVTSLASGVLYYNSRFLKMWGLPAEVLQSKELGQLTNMLLVQVEDPESFARRAAELNGTMEESYATFGLKDGRVVEFYSRPLLDTDGVAGRVWSCRDVTERERSAAALRESEERFRAVVQRSSDMIMILDATGAPTYTSPSVERIMGYALLDWQRLGVLSLVHPDDLQRSVESLESVLSASGAHPATVIRFRCADGAWREIEMVANNMLDDPAVSGVVYNARDVTEQRLAERAMKQSEERFRSLVQNAADLITVIDPATKVLYQSPSSAHMLGYEPHEMYGSQLVRFIHRDDLPVLLNFVREVMTKAVGPLSIELRLLHKDGSWRAVEIMGTDQRANASIGGIVLNTRDIGERKILEDQLRHQAFSDVLTGLANRARFTDHLEHGLLRAKRERTVVAVVFLDLDDFKSINDGLGHAAGDALLVAVAARLRESVRPGDTVARFGGDEFAVLLEDASGANEAVEVAERIVEALRPPFEIDGHQWFIRASLGVSFSTSGQIDADDLMRNADVAMYVAKGRGKGRFELYEESMRDALLERVALLNDLQEAIAKASEFVVYYQPVLRLETGEIAGVEALVRWQHPQRGLLPPDQFISLAEESGAILPLGRWVLEQACRQVRAWQVEYPLAPRLTVAVNVSVRQLQHPGFLQEVREALEGSALDPGDLVLEITESVMMQDVETMIARLGELKSLGILLAIDDFGTGYSSLSYLQQFPLDILKIDQSFVSTVSQGVDGSDLTRAIVQIARTLGLETVAEGIEQIEQLSALRSLGCDLGQGYYFARPLSPVHMDAYLALATRERHAA